MTTTFANPIQRGADPWMTYFRGRYYLTTSQGDCIRMWSGRTISELASTDAVTLWKDSDPTRCAQMWAAEFHRIGARWYMYYTASDGVDANHRIYALESEGDDPLGPYTFKSQMTPFWAIDPGLLVLPDGDLYFMWTGAHNGNSLYIARMDDPWTMCGDGVLISTAQHDWEKCGFPVNEAPEILQRDGRIFLVYSASDTGTPDYCLGMLAADASSDLLAPESWVKWPDPVFRRNDAAGVFGPGHNGFFKSPDGQQDWLVYHAKTTAEYTYAGRTTRVQPFTWREDGLPDLGSPISLDDAQSEPSGTCLDGT
jgi:GH43 family beta-xylosidase